MCDKLEFCNKEDFVLIVANKDISKQQGSCAVLVKVAPTSLSQSWRNCEQVQTFRVAASYKLLQVIDSLLHTALSLTRADEIGVKPNA